MAAQDVQAIFYQGEFIDREDFIPSGVSIANGEVVNMGNGYFGICTSPQGIADGKLGSLAINGVWKLAKAESVVTFAVGAVVDWDDTGNLAVAYTQGGAALSIGVAVKAAAATDNHVKCRLIPMMERLLAAA